MKSRLLTLIALSLLLVGCASGGRFVSPHATGHYKSTPTQCVPYARSVSGIQIYGDAHTWWGQAARRGYAQGRTPQPGAVLVLSRTSRMTHGHLAVVRNVIDSRHIDVTHSNWGSDRKTRRIIYEAMRVEDISSSNNWSSVRFWNYEKNCFGFPYAAHGFIYR